MIVTCRLQSRLKLQLQKKKKKMRLRVTGYYQGEYLYSLSNEGLIMNYKEYVVNKQKKCSGVKNNEKS